MDTLIGPSMNCGPAPLIILAFDLRLGLALFREFQGVCAAKEFQIRFEEFSFIIVLLGKGPIFVIKTGDVVTLSFHRIPDSFGVLKASEIGSALSELLEIIQLNKDLGPFPDSIFVFLHEISKLSEGHAFLFYSGFFPVVEFGLHFSLNLIEVVDNLLLWDPIVISQALENGWSHCLIHGIEKSLLTYLHGLVRRSVTSKVKISIQVSEGLQMCWISGVKNEKDVSCAHLEFEFSQYLSSLTLFLALGPKRGFGKSRFFSLQTVFVFANDQTIVSNRIWKKADSLEEWKESVNIVTYVSFFMKQQSARELLNKGRFGLFFSRRFEWSVNEQTQFIRKAAALFSDLFVAGTSEVPIQVRRDVLYLVMTRGHSYIGTLVSRLITLTGEEDEFVFPPFILSVNDRKVFVDSECGMVPVWVELKSIDALRRQITRLCHSL
jgi:hypothetical protein